MGMLDLRVWDRVSQLTARVRETGDGGVGEGRRDQGV